MDIPVMLHSTGWTTSPGFVGDFTEIPAQADMPPAHGTFKEASKATEGEKMELGLGQSVVCSVWETRRNNCALAPLTTHYWAGTMGLCADRWRISRESNGSAIV